MAIRRSSHSTRQTRPVPKPPGGAEQEREPIASWEIPLDHDLATYVDPGPEWGAAYIPSRWRSIPRGAADALTELISVERPNHVLVAPAGVRRVNGADIYCPTQILAAGEHAVALWVDALPFDRIAAVLAYRDIRMVEHRATTESAHLTVIGATGRFTLHYRPSWLPHRATQVQTLVMRIRRRAAGSSPNNRARHDRDPRQDGAASPEEDTGASRVVLSCNAHGWMKWSPWRRHSQGGRRTAELTDRELVVQRTPTSRWERHVGKDILAVPRRHLRRLSATGPTLCIDAGVTHDITVGAAFARRIVRQFSPIAGEPPALAHSLQMRQGSADVRL